MKDIVRRFGWFRLVAVGLTVLPMLLLPILGTLWLWESGMLLWWLMAAAAASLIGFGFTRVAIFREQRALPAQTTSPGAHWSVDAERCFDQINALADRATLLEWPLNDGTRLLQLTRQILDLTAGHLHPHSRQPLLEMTLPHTLVIIERAARALRQDIVEQIPFSHELSLGGLVRARSWQTWFKRHESWFRAGRVLLTPQSAIVAELRRAVGNQAFQHGSERIQM